MTGLLGQLLPMYIICARALAGRPIRYARSHAFTHCLSDLHVVYGVRYRGTVRDDNDSKCATESNSSQHRTAARIGAGAAVETNVVRGCASVQCAQRDHLLR